MRRKNLSHLTLFCSMLILLLFTACSGEELVVFRGQTMGTFYSVKIAERVNLEKQREIQNTIDSVLAAVNHSLNRFDKNSEISAFNRYRGQEPFQISADFMKVSRMADEIYRCSQGAFDPTISPLLRLWGFGSEAILHVPHPDTLTAALKHVGFNKMIIHENALQKIDPRLELDYSAIAKGYGVDCLAEALQGLGYGNILIEIGGELRALGKGSGKGWRIGIASPGQDAGEVEGSPDYILLHNKSCATSGDYRQFYMLKGKAYSHLIDPKSGYPIAHELTSLTVIADNCMLADAAATAAIVLGKEQGAAFIESLEAVEAFFIFREGEKLRSMQSSGWKAFLP